MADIRYFVREVFRSIQGEGSRTGQLSVFVRFAGCNLWDGIEAHRGQGRGACARWCDTDFADGTKLTLPALLERCESLLPKPASGERWIVATGGEPLLQLDAPLLRAWHAAGWKVAVETNGSLNPMFDDVMPIIQHIDHVVCSPKRGVAIALPCADEVKVVLPGDVEHPWRDEDLLALEKGLRPKFCYVQPDWNGGKFDMGLAACLSFMERHPQWRLSVQTHRWLGLP